MGYQSDLILSEILDGLKQVDDSFSVTSFDAIIDKETRNISVKFTAETESGEKVDEVIDYA